MCIRDRYDISSWSNNNASPHTHCHCLRCSVTRDILTNIVNKLLLITTLLKWQINRVIVRYSVLYLGDVGSCLSVVNLPTLWRVELERSPRPAEVDALVDWHGVRTLWTELKTHVGHLYRRTHIQTDTQTVTDRRTDRRTDVIMSRQLTVTLSLVSVIIISRLTAAFSTPRAF